MDYEIRIKAKNHQSKTTMESEGAALAYICEQRETRGIERSSMPWKTRRRAQRERPRELEIERG